MDEKYDPLEHIMDTEEAGKRWGLSEQRVRALCSSGEIKAKRMKRDWAIVKDQHYSRKRSKKKSVQPKESEE